MSTPLLILVIAHTDFDSLTRFSANQYQIVMSDARTSTGTLDEVVSEAASYLGVE